MGGMRLSGQHFRRGMRREPARGIQEDGYFAPNQGAITVEYPLSKIPIPENGRYRLHLETEDCIACDKCARICPVDCITIDSFKADGDLGQTSDGTTKRLHLPVFDIDMAKCMFCGLCTTVCPTECLTMTPAYDFSEFDRDNLTYHFGALSPEEEAVVRAETEAALAAKKAQKAAVAPTPPTEPQTDAPKTFTPKRKPVVTELLDPEQSLAETPTEGIEAPKTFAPRRKPVMPNTDEKTEEKPAEPEALQTFTPRRKPVMRPEEPKAETPQNDSVINAEESQTETTEPAEPKAFTPRRKPVMKPQAPSETSEIAKPESEQPESEQPQAEKPAFTPRRKPIMKPLNEDKEGSDESN